ncbi:kinetochore-associated Ndc80 complex subunit nuf2 [Boothiomyces sp. JEL0838]|nr:kinetochore-associated Ndc80 complex subunit nuf2 [Boothiomyces sp. JEL0838]
MSELTFPNLDTKEILQILIELSIPCTEEDLKKPTMHKMLQIYEKFTELLLGSTRNLAVPDFSTLLETPDLQQDSIALMGFYRQLLKIVTQAGVENFSLRDLLTPSVKRVRYILSAIINFCKFREDKMQIYEQCSEQAEALANQKVSLQAKLDDLTEKVNSYKYDMAYYRASRVAETPMVEKKREVVSLLTADLRELKKIQTNIGGEIDALKLEKSQLTEKMNNNTFLITNLKQECARLQSRIITNPEKLKLAIDDMIASVKIEKANVAASEKKSRELQVRIETMDSVEADIENCCDLLLEAEQERKKKRDEQARYQKDAESLQRKQEELRELTMREQQLLRQLESANSKIVRLEQHHSQRESANEQKFVKLKEEYEEVVRQHQSSVAKAQENENQAAEYEEKTETYQNTVEGEINSLNLHYNNLILGIEAFQNTIQASKI